MPAEHIGFKIRTLSNLIKLRINQMISEEENTLTAHQIWVLDYIASHPDQEIIQRDIEAHFSIRRSTASHMLQLMEKNGYLIRLSAPDDARMKNLVLTAKGIESQKRMKERLCRFEALLSSGFSPEELQYLEILLKRLGDNIK